MQGAGDLVGILGVVLGVPLVVVALDEDGAFPAGVDGTGEDAGDVLTGALVGVGLLRASQLPDGRAGTQLHGGAAAGRGHVEDLRAQVDGRLGPAAVLVTRASHVQLVDAGRRTAQLLGGFPDDPAGGLDDGLVLAEGRAPGDVLDAGGAEGRDVVDDEALALEMADAVEVGDEFADGRGDTRGGHVEPPVGVEQTQVCFLA